MKKLYFYLVSMLVAAVVAVGCTEDTTTDEIYNGPLGEVEKEMITITASLECDEPAEGEESRTTLTDNNGGKIVWSEGDAIGVVSADNTITKAVALKVNGSNASFEVPTDIKYAVYPWQESSKLFITAAGILAQTLPSVITLDGSDRVFADNENVMVAHLSDDNTLSFKNFCGFIEIKLKGTQTVKHISLRSNSKGWNQTLSGLQYIKTSDPKAPTRHSASGQAKTWSYINATCPNVQLSTDESKSFYFCVPPATYKNLNICIQTNKGSYSITSKNDIVVNRSKIRPIAAINVDNILSKDVTNLCVTDADIANCYIIPQGSEAKCYSFPTRRLNADAAIADVAYAHIIWSEGEQLVSNVCFADGRVSFKYEGGNAEGNALVGVFDANNVLLWSWHIWCTDKPQQISVANSTGSKIYGILDRNLGATYAPKTEAEAQNISETNATASMGLYYQYGRPTPFPKSTSIKSTTTETTAFDATTTDYALMYGFGTYAQQFVKSSNTSANYENVCSFENLISKPNIFGVISFTDNTATTASSEYKSTNSFCKDPVNACDRTARLKAWHSENQDKVSQKGNNDPCPAGYVIEDGHSVNYYVAGFDYNKVVSGSNLYGYYHKCTKTGKLVWIPATGFRNQEGQYSYVGNNFNWWAVPDNTNTAALYTIRLHPKSSTDTTMKPQIAGYNTTAFGFNVRCRVIDRSGLQGATTVTTFEGQGTSASPYLIKTADDLVKLSNLCNGSAIVAGTADFKSAYYALAANINMSGKAFTPITNFSGSFDGKTYTISNLTVKEVVGKPVGMFGDITGATIKNVKITNGKIDVNNAASCFDGGIAGKAFESTIQNCSYSGTIDTEASALVTSTFGSNGATSFAAGIAGYIVNTTIEGCEFSGNITAKGQFVGGIAAHMEGGKISNCKVKNGSRIKNTANHIAGIVSRMTNDAEILSCTVDATTIETSEAYHGGIVGRMESGVISGCLVTSGTNIISHANHADYFGQYHTGGLVGYIANHASRGTKLTIKDCAVYADIQANCVMGGLVGEATTLANTSLPLDIVNCIYKGSLSSLYKYSDKYPYAHSAGIAGIVNNTNDPVGKVTIANCAAFIDSFIFNPIATTGGYGGLYSYAKKANWIACYTPFDSATMVSTEGKKIGTYGDQVSMYGNLYANGNGNNLMTDCFYVTGKAGANSVASGSTLTAYANSDMKSAAFLAALNTAATKYNSTAPAELKASTWVAGPDGYPVPSTIQADPNRGITKKLTRVSIIGDSISTFKGWMPAGYAHFYPIAENPTVISATQTYWYKLIYNYMSNATLEKNIAWSGTLVTRSTNTAMSSQHWYGNSFVERFIDKGMGDPDVIILHGGTNDVSSRGNKSNASIRLHPSLPIYHDTNYSASAHPTDAQMNTIYTTAEAATTRAQVEALTDTSFAEAYVKLICMMHNRYPNAKVVMVIGDWIPSGTAWVIQRIANHYASKWGYRCVNLLDISGFQTYDKIPKESGCHPNEAGFEVMANYIYQQVGTYIDPAN